MEMNDTSTNSITKLQFLIVSQLALGDAIILRREIVEPLLTMGHGVTILCNANNKFVFDDFPCIVEDWPLSTRRFYSIRQFFNIVKSIGLPVSTIVWIPSGHFLEKVYSYIKFFKFKNVRSVNIRNGLRRRLNNQIAGNFIHFRNDIDVHSFDSYGAHAEFFSLAYRELDKNYDFKNSFKNKLRKFIVQENIKKVYIQVSALVAQKAMSHDFVDLLIVACDPCALFLISDTKTSDYSHGEAIHIYPKDVPDQIDKDGNLLFLLDSFLMHLLAPRTDNVIFMYVAQEYAYDWLPRNVTPISSQYSLFYRI
jgi:hypothetical protein